LSNIGNKQTPAEGFFNLSSGPQAKRQEAALGLAPKQLAKAVRNEGP